MSLAPCRFPRGRVKSQAFTFHKGVTYTVHGILTFIKRLTGFCLKSLHHRFVAWTKPSTTALILGTLTDLARSKSELVAENALLRQQLIILRRQVKRPACTKRTGCSWFFWQGWFGPGNKPYSLSSQRRFCVGIVRGFNCIGSTNLERLCPNQR